MTRKFYARIVGSAEWLPRSEMETRAVAECNGCGKILDESVGSNATLAAWPYRWYVPAHGVDFCSDCDPRDGGSGLLAALD